MICMGECSKHGKCTGVVQFVRVSGGRMWQNEDQWGKYHYCETAIEEDRRRGFTVKVIKESEQVAQKRVDNLRNRVKNTEDELKILNELLRIAFEDLRLIKEGSPFNE